MRRVTLKDIAARAGVHLSTVSLALRDDLRLAKATRARIQTLAEEMGYVPDPTMKALSAYRSSIRPHEVQSGLAYLTDMEGTHPFHAKVYQTAKERAARLGYNLIEFNLSEPGSSLDRLRSIWWNMGLRGVLLGPFRHSGTVLDEDWDRWVTVAFGHSVTHPNFNRAVFNHFQNMLVHLDELWARGYKRLGLCLPAEISDRYPGSPPCSMSARAIEASREGKDLNPGRSGNHGGTELEKWIRKERIEVVIGYGSTHAQLSSGAGKYPKKSAFPSSRFLANRRGRSGRIRHQD